MTLRSILCRLLGGHELSLPVIVDGRYRLRCLHNCGYLTPGVDVSKKENPHDC